MPIGRINILKRFGKNDRGAAALEFAIVAAPLIAIILAALQTAIIFLMSQAVQTATEKAARELMTGTAQSSAMTQGTFHTFVCNQAPFLTCNNLMVDVQSASAYTFINTAALTPVYSGGAPTTNWTTYSPGNAGDIVIMRVMYNWPVFGGPLALNLANQSNGTYLLVGTAVFKNEPYQ